jgi:hypothetical protein
LFNDVVEVDVHAVADETRRRVDTADSAIELLQIWDAEVQTVRAERASVEQVAALPILTRDLRVIIARESENRGVDAPSTNQIRRRLGAWYRSQLRDLVGPMKPPVANFTDALQDLAKAGATIAPRVEAEAQRIVVDAITNRSADESVAVPAKSSAPVAQSQSA